MAFTGKKIFGIGLATAVVACITTDVIVRNTKKFRTLKKSDKTESKKK